MRIEYDTWTCSIARPHAHMQAIKKMTPAEFIAQVVLALLAHDEFLWERARFHYK